jgi:uncharacterized protein
MLNIQNLPAGEFSSWLQNILKALIAENGIDVPCGECTACCSSSKFIHIRPEEKQTLAKIPKDLLFPAPGLPEGNVLLGYDENGLCPMLTDNKCSIYGHRPLTCRNYDCRIFVAAEIAGDDDDKNLITQQVKRWKFDYPTKLDKNQQLAIQTAVKFLQEQSECFPGGVVPKDNAQIAILAIKVYDVFLDELNKIEDKLSNQALAKAIMDASEKFEARRRLEKAKQLS